VTAARTELLNAHLLRIAGLAAPGRQWGLRSDAQLVAATDEPMTDEQAQHWARRMLGDHVTFEPWRADGCYRVADPARPRGH
jgi:hypothetical protein